MKNIILSSFNPKTQTTPRDHVWQLMQLSRQTVLQSNAFAVVGGDKVHGCLLIGVTLNLSYLTLKNLQSGSENPVLVFGVEFGLFLFNCLYIIGPTR